MPRRSLHSTPNFATSRGTQVSATSRPRLLHGDDQRTTWPTARAPEPTSAEAYSALSYLTTIRAPSQPAKRLCRSVYRRTEAWGRTGRTRHLTAEVGSPRLTAGLSNPRSAFRQRPASAGRRMSVRTMSGSAMLRATSRSSERGSVWSLHLGGRRPLPGKSPLKPWALALLVDKDAAVTYTNVRGSTEDAEEARGGPNHGLSLRNARRDYQEIGASNDRLTQFVRAPLPTSTPTAAHRTERGSSATTADRHWRAVCLCITTAPDQGGTTGNHGERNRPDAVTTRPFAQVSATTSRKDPQLPKLMSGEGWGLLRRPRRAVCGPSESGQRRPATTNDGRNHAARRRGGG
ncbi:CPCC family cysteine-rich protein [Streptomyces sp. NPDC058420]|uniref:CPCC family cysteine-rich protein n=1 Tax=Streptomyces sp. NPDC058420 TaxID=3346489 RepID=UPI00365B8847